MNATRRPEVTDASFVRSHGTAPRGRGSWAFQMTRGPSAYTDELQGEIFWHNGTYAAARKAAQEHFADCEMIAALS